MKNKVFLIVGMAGSGKSTFSHRLYDWISREKYKTDKTTGLNGYIYSINLDPAVYMTKMPLCEDIRDHFDIEEIKEKYNLGPNGAVTTCLNLYALQLDTLVEKIKDYKYVIIDTPGQIEAFTWSSFGFVLVDALKSLENTEVYVLYTIDSHYSTKPEVFMSNMIFASSIACFYDSKIICLFNKMDQIDEKDKLMNWMRDYDSFRESLDDNAMCSPMLSSLSLYLEDLYNFLDACFISATTGEGKHDFYKLIGESIDLDKLDINPSTKQ